MQEFITYLKQISPLTEESCNAFVSKCKTFNFPKKKYLLKSGQISQHLYFVKSGIGKVFYLKDDKEIIDWISDEGNLLTSVSSFLTQTPSLHDIRLIEDSELIGISYTDLEDLFSKYHELERLGRQLTIMALVQLQNRINSMQFETAKKRYENFLINYPNCINRISLGDLASFLGMTQVTLSRVRALK
ncbi:MAG: Crp/Fnr family transcriptional regulator [Saprospiraceae bacterium]